MVAVCKYDVFLSHRSKDEAVEWLLAERLFRKPIVEDEADASK